MTGAGIASWARAAILVGVAYLVVGLVSPALVRGAGSVAAWRLGAWLASAVAFGAHLAFEQLRLRSSPATTAFHGSLAVALGAGALAAVATARALVTDTGRPVMLAISVVAWPLLTGVPAFLVGFAVVKGISLAVRRSRSSSPGGSSSG